MKLEYYSNVDQEGKLQPSISKLIAKELGHFKGKRVEIKISKLGASRTTQQNRYLHVIIKILADYLGYDKDEMKEMIKYKFLLKTKVIEETGEELEYVGKTSKLNKEEFSELVEGMKRWSAEGFGVVLPDPGEQLEMYE